MTAMQPGRREVSDAILDVDHLGDPWTDPELTRREPGGCDVFIGIRPQSMTGRICSA